MDFVVVGIILGAIIVGAGEVVRTIGPRRNSWIKQDAAQSNDRAGVKIGWNRFCQATGLLAMTMGLFVLLVTVLATVGHASDATGKVAVGASTALAIAVVAGCGHLIATHYRRGGFDPRIVSVGEAAHPIANQPGIADADDVLPSASSSADELFDLIGPVAISGETTIEGMPTVAEVVAAESDAVVSDSDNLVEPKTTEDDQSSALALTLPEPSADVDPDPELLAEGGWNSQVNDVHAEDLADEPDLELELPIDAPDHEPVEEWAAYQPALNRLDDPPAHAATNGWSVSAPISRYEQSPDDLDDELPAWNAPPPAPKPVVEERVRTAPTRPQIATGFESSLFANLEIPESGQAENEGRFSSKLLNELTTTEDEPGEPVADVLLNEFSLPDPDASNSTGPDQNR